MAKKKSSKSLSQLLMTIITIVLGLAICVPLFINVWNYVTTIGELDPSVAELGGYFGDYSAFVDTWKLSTNEAVFMDWASMVAGIALIVALVGAVLYIAGAVTSMISSNKLCNTLTKIGSIIMLIAGIVILVATIIFVMPSAELGSSVRSASMALGAWIGIIAPIGAGIVGLLSTKK